jgi:hypothetical protein
MKIKIINYKGFVKGDDNLTQNSIHEVVEPTEVEAKGSNGNGMRGYWVKGSLGENILVLFEELEIVKDKSRNEL